MKHPSVLLLLPSAFLLFACGQAKKPAVAPPAPGESAVSTDSAPPPPPPMAGADNPGQRNAGGPGGGNPGQRLERMKESLGLTQAQADQIKTIFDAQQPAMAALRNDQTLSREDRRAKLQALRQETDVKLSAILTPEQKAKWEEERAKRRAQMGNRPQEGAPGGAPQGNPPPGM